MQLWKLYKQVGVYLILENALHQFPVSQVKRASCMSRHLRITVIFIVCASVNDVWKMNEVCMLKKLAMSYQVNNPCFLPVDWSCHLDPF